MANREERARIAAETVAIIQAGEYTAPSGRNVSIKEAVQRSTEASVLITPDDSLHERANRVLAGRAFDTRFEVRNETTFAAARRLASSRVAVLNFASAKNPGGGFLSGSQAQEESLASALHATLERHMAYYHANRSASLLYTDHMIVSPDVPVFRDDNDELLEEPWTVTIITSPAPTPSCSAARAGNATHTSVTTPAIRSCLRPVFFTAATKSSLSQALIWPGRGMNGASVHTWRWPFSRSPCPRA